MSESTTTTAQPAAAAENRASDAVAEATTGAASAAASAAADSIRGRSAFHVEVSGAGLVVHTVFAADDGRVMPMPAVFTDVHYALQQIDALRQIVIDRFAQAAQVGAQVIAAQRAKAAAEPPPPQVAVDAAAAA